MKNTITYFMIAVTLAAMLTGCYSVGDDFVIPKGNVWFLCSASALSIIFFLVIRKYLNNKL